MISPGNNDHLYQRKWLSTSCASWCTHTYTHILSSLLFSYLLFFPIYSNFVLLVSQAFSNIGIGLVDIAKSSVGWAKNKSPIQFQILRQLTILFAFSLFIYFFFCSPSDIQLAALSGLQLLVKSVPGASIEGIRGSAARFLAMLAVRKQNNQKKKKNKKKKKKKQKKKQKKIVERCEETYLYLLCLALMCQSPPFLAERTTGPDSATPFPRF